MSDLSRLLDDVYQNGPAAPTPKRTAPEAAAPAPEPEAELPETALAWDSESTLDDAFSDWVPGPTADSPQAERDLFDFGVEEPAPASLLEHVFADDAPPAAAAPEAAADEPENDLTDLFDEVPVAPAAPAPQPVELQVDEREAAPVAPEAPAGATVRPLAYQPPMSLAEALGEAPDSPPADLVRPVEAPEPAEWALAGLAPAPVEAAAFEADPDTAGATLTTSWRREHDDLLPARAGRRRR